MSRFRVEVRTIRAGQPRAYADSVYESDIIFSNWWDSTTGEREGNVVANIKRKEADMMAMFDGMVKHMGLLMTEELKAFKKTKTDYFPKIEMKLPKFMEVAE